MQIKNLENPDGFLLKEAVYFRERKSDKQLPLGISDLIMSTYYHFIN